MADLPQNPPHDDPQPDAQQPGDRHHEDPPPENPPQLTLPDDPERWERGDWAFDPKEDAAWEDPAILRRRIETPEEVEVVADAVVRRYAITLADPTGEEREIVDAKGTLTRYARVWSLNAVLSRIFAHQQVCWDGRYVLLSKGHPTTVHRTDPIAHHPKPLGESGVPTHLDIRESVVENFSACEDDVYIPLSLCCLILTTCDCGGARFQGGLVLDHCHFKSKVDFNNCTFGGHSGVFNTHFDADTKIGLTIRPVTEFRIDGCAFERNFVFGVYQFSGDAIMYGLVVKGCLTVQRAAARSIAIDDCVIEGGLSLSNVFAEECVSCRGTTVYGQLMVQGLNAGLSFEFPKTVGGMASFQGCNIYGFLTAIHTEFQSSVQFDTCQFFSSVVFQDAVMRGSCIFNRTRMVGDRCRIRAQGYSSEPIVAFVRCRVHSRLSLASVIVGPAYRLDFSDIEFANGGSLGVSVEQLFPRKTGRIGSKRTSSSSAARRRRSPWRLLWHSILGINNNPRLSGENSTCLRQCGQARNQYEMLVATLALQRGKELLEDKCRWRANELRRRKSLIEHWSRVMGPVSISNRFWRGIFDLRISSGRAAWFLIYDIIWKWLIERTMIGNLLYVHRPIVTGLVLAAVCGVLFGVFASPDTIAYNGALPAFVEAGSPEADAYAMQMWSHGSGLHSLASGMSFSLTTFVTLGYGDFAPLGWFKLVTGLEALAGVTLIALFTVAWGRKMVR